jgi:hypothetical protein
VGDGDFEAASNATLEPFVTSATPQPDSLWDRTIDLALLEGRAAYALLEDEDEELEDTDVVRDWATFDDDERWRETARTGRAL